MIPTGSLPQLSEGKPCFCGACLFGCCCRRGGLQRLNPKMTEFLVADRFPVSALIGIGGENRETAEMARRIVAPYYPDLPVKVF